MKEILENFDFAKKNNIVLCNNKYNQDKEN